VWCCKGSLCREPCVRECSQWDKIFFFLKEKLKFAEGRSSSFAVAGTTRVSCNVSRQVSSSSLATRFANRAAVGEMPQIGSRHQFRHFSRCLPALANPDDSLSTAGGALQSPERHDPPHPSVRRKSNQGRRNDSLRASFGFGLCGVPSLGPVQILAGQTRMETVISEPVDLAIRNTEFAEGVWFGSNPSSVRLKSSLAHMS
jgi:hypothetical protein